MDKLKSFIISLIFLIIFNIIFLIIFIILPVNKIFLLLYIFFNLSFTFLFFILLIKNLKNFNFINIINKQNLNSYQDNKENIPTLLIDIENNRIQSCNKLSIDLFNKERNYIIGKKLEDIVNFEYINFLLSNSDYKYGRINYDKSNYKIVKLINSEIKKINNKSYRELFLLDITEEFNYLNRIKIELDYNMRINSIGKILIGKDIIDFKNKIKEILRIIGEYTNTERVILWYFRKDKNLFYIYEFWSKINIELKNEYDLTDYPNFERMITNDRIIYFNDFNDIPSNYENEKKLIEKLNIKSFLVSPYFNTNNILNSIITISTYNYKHEFTELEINFIRIVTIILSNIIESIEINKELEYKNKFLEQMIDCLPIPVYYKDLDLKYKRVNKSFCELIGLPDVDILNKGIEDISKDEEVIKLIIRKDFEILKNLKSQVYPTIVRRRDGVIREVIVFKSVMYNIENKPEGIIGSVIDITDLKKTQRLLEENLKEKNILLSEIHHRVKNNLQIIISLLNLQLETITDNYTISILKDIISRILSISLVHENLYQRKNFSKININEYFNNLALYINNTYNNKNIIFNLDIDEIELSINESIPLGLIINELITNSIKHGFKNKIDGIITIIFKKLSNEYKIFYKDNGIGLPDNFDIRNIKSLGIQLIIDLTHQLQGCVNFKNENGFVAQIDLPCLK